LRGGGEGAETGMDERGRVGVGFVVWAEGSENENRGGGFWSEGFEGGGGLGGEVVSAHCVDG